MFLTNHDIVELTAWRQKLHAMPEISGEEVATARYVNFLDQNCLNESDVPLLKADFSQIGRVTTDGPDDRRGRVFRDVSAGARQYLKDHPVDASGPQQPQDPLAAATRAGGRAFREGVPRSVREFVPPAPLQEQLVAHRAAAQLRKGQSDSLAPSPAP